MSIAADRVRNFGGFHVFHYPIPSRFEQNHSQAPDTESQPQADDSDDLDYGKSKKAVKKNQKKKNAKQKTTKAATVPQLMAQLDAIDQFLTIDTNEEEAAPAKVGKCNTKTKKSLVATTVAHAQDITMKDRVNLELISNKLCQQNGQAQADDDSFDYDKDFLNELGFGSDDEQQSNVELDQQVPNAETSVHINDFNPQQDMQNFHEEMQDMIKSCTTPRKRRSSVTIDERMNAKNPRVDKEAEDAVQGINHSSPVSSAMPVKVVNKSKSRKANLKRKLIIDNKIEILQHSTKPTPTVDSPLDNFAYFLHCQKSNHDVLFASPLTRACKGKIFMTTFKRNLKVVPGSLNKHQKFNEAGDVVEVASPKRMRYEFENDYSFKKKNENDESEVYPEPVEISTPKPIRAKLMAKKKQQQKSPPSPIPCSNAFSSDSILNLSVADEIDINNNDVELSSMPNHEDGIAYGSPPAANQELEYHSESCFNYVQG